MSYVPTIPRPEVQNKLIKSYIAMLLKQAPWKIRLETFSKDHMYITGQVVQHNEEVLSEFSYEQTKLIAELVEYLLTNHSEELDDLLHGYFPSTKLHQDIIRTQHGIIISRNFQGAALRDFAEQVNDDTMFEQLLSSISFQLENYHEDLMANPDVKAESQIRAMLTELSQMIMHEDIPEDRMLQAIADTANKPVETIVEDMLNELSTAGDETAKTALRNLAFKRYHASVNKNLEGLDNFIPNHPAIRKNFDANLSTEDCITNIRKHLSDEKQFRKDLQQLLEERVRSGKNILMLQQLSKQTQERIIRETLEDNLSAGHCLSRMIETACDHYPDLCEAEGKDLIYSASDYAEIEKLRSGEASLYQKTAYLDKDEIPWGTSYLFNYRFEILDIRLSISHDYSVLNNAVPGLQKHYKAAEFEMVLKQLGKNRSANLSIEQWIEDYEVELDEEGGFVEVDFSDSETIARLRQENRLWTEYDHGLITNEVAYANRFRYLVSKKPHVHPDTDLIYVVPPFEVESINQNHELQVTARAETLLKDPIALQESIKAGLDHAFEYFHDSYENGILADDHEEIEDILKKLFQAQAALERLSKLQ